MKKLIIAEKPSVALKIAANGRKILGDFYLKGNLITKEYLEKNEESLKKTIKYNAGFVENDNYIISFAEGHLVGLYQAKDYNPEYANWRKIPYQYIPNPFKTKVIQEKLYNNLYKLITSDKVDTIINACDLDREGSNIFNLIYNQTKCKKTRLRLSVSTHTEDELLEALNKLEDETLPKHYNLCLAGKCREDTDFLMGALGTSTTTVYLGTGLKGDIISVGRVQTAVLNEIVRVELLNRNFKSKKFYHILGKFKTKDGKIYEGVYNNEDYDDINKVKRIINQLKKEGKINDYKNNKVNIYSESLFDQTALQIRMASVYKYDPSKTLDIAQSLYEKGYASYPRTTSSYIMKSDAKDFDRMYQLIASINPLALNYPFNKNNTRIVNDKYVDSHPAIIPTVEVPNLQKLSSDARVVYEEIVRRVISVNYPPAVDEKQTIITSVSGYDFKSTGCVEKSRGWREVYDIKEKNNALPFVTINDIVEVVSLEPKEIVTKPPQRYTNASILLFMKTCGKKIENEEMRELMKNKGIGTTSTRAMIIKKLEDTKYIEFKGKDGQTIYPTEKGIEMIQKFPVDELKNPEFTGEMEYQLYKVEKGKLSDKEFMNQIYDLYKLSCEKIKGAEKMKSSESGSTDGICDCMCKNGKIIKKKGKFGEFYGCTDYKNGCKISINKICGKILTENQTKTLFEKKETGYIKGFKKNDGTELSPAKVILNDDGTTKLVFKSKK